MWLQKRKGTVDIIFAAKQLQEKCREQNLDVYTVFVVLTKAFDTVRRNRLWKIMAKFGCPEKVKVSMKRCCIDPNDREDLASNHPAWRSKV